MKELIFITSFLYLLFGSIAGAFMEVNFLNWLIINYIIAIIAAVLNYIIWIFHRHSKRYFSFQYIVVMIVLTYYLMSPAFVSLYPSTYFWFLLTITIGIAILIFVNRVMVVRAILYPQKGAVIIFTIFIVVFICLAIMSPSRRSEGSMPALRGLYYLVGLGLISFSPAILFSQERAKGLENLPEKGIKKEFKESIGKDDGI